MLKHKRLKKGLTQSTLAKRLKISKSYLSILENHPYRCNPTVKLILNLSKELDIHPIKTFIYFIKKQ